MSYPQNDFQHVMCGVRYDAVTHKWKGVTGFGAVNVNAITTITPTSFSVKAGAALNPRLPSGCYFPCAEPDETYVNYGIEPSIRVIDGDNIVVNLYDNRGVQAKIKGGAGGPNDWTVSSPSRPSYVTGVVMDNTGKITVSHEESDLANGIPLIMPIHSTTTGESCPYSFRAQSVNSFTTEITVWEIVGGAQQQVILNNPNIVFSFMRPGAVKNISQASWEQMAHGSASVWIFTIWNGTDPNTADGSTIAVI